MKLRRIKKTVPFLGHPVHYLVKRKMFIAHVILLSQETAEFIIYSTVTVASSKFARFESR